MLFTLEEEYAVAYQTLSLEASQTGAFAFIKLDFINKNSGEPSLQHLLNESLESCLAKGEELADSFITQLLRNHSREIAILANIVNEKKEQLKKILSIALVIIIARI